jgi:hypothetical protein
MSQLINNLVTNGFFVSGTTGWLPAASTLSVAGNILSVTGNGANSTSYTYYRDISKLFIQNHKYYFKANIMVTNPNCTSIQLTIGTNGAPVNNLSNPVQNQQYTLSGIWIADAANNGLQLDIRIINRYIDAATANGKVMQVQQVFVLDLTARYGTGNEPTQAWCDANITPVGLEWYVTTTLIESSANISSSATLTAETKLITIIQASANLSGNSELTADTIVKIVTIALASATITATATMTANAYKYKVILTGLTTDKGNFFKFNSNLYYIHHGGMYVYNGVTATAVIPYIPLTIINRTPTGGGTINEQYNRIGAGFINAFNGTGTNVPYTLTDTNLDAAVAVASYDSGVTWDKIEGVDFTVNRTTGVVTWTAIQPIGQNNIRVKAYKTDTAALNSILDCLYAIPFGGQNDNRVFIGGNGTGYYYWTGISSVGVDATYWAYNNYNIIGNSDENITGFGKQYDILCIFKEKEIYGESYYFDGTIGVFNSFPVNSQIGCDCPETIQNVNNNLTWLNSMGVYVLVGTAVESQRNVFPISRNVNPQLLKETNLKLASSVNFDGKYWLCINDKVYLWDYTISPYVDTGNPDKSAELLSWWYFDNINAYSWITEGQDLYYIDRASAKIVKFHTTYDSSQFYDFGMGINSVYKVPERDFGGSIFEFDVIDVWVDVRGDTKTAFNVTYFTSDDPNGIAEDEGISVGSFSLKNFSLKNFTLRVMGKKTTFPLRPNEKNISLFGVEFANDLAGRDMNISNIVMSYLIKKKKR